MHAFVVWRRKNSYDRKGWNLFKGLVINLWRRSSFLPTDSEVRKCHSTAKRQIIYSDPLLPWSILVKAGLGPRVNPFYMRCHRHWLPWSCILSNTCQSRALKGAHLFHKMLPDQLASVESNTGSLLISLCGSRPTGQPLHMRDTKVTPKWHPIDTRVTPNWHPSETQMKPIWHDTAESLRVNHFYMCRRSLWSKSQ